MNVSTLKKLPEELKLVKFSSIAWTHDHNGFFYQVLYSVGVPMVIWTCVLYVGHMNTDMPNISIVCMSHIRHATYLCSAL